MIVSTKTLVSTRVCAGECGSPEERAFIAYCHYRQPIDIGGQHGAGSSLGESIDCPGSVRWVLAGPTKLMLVGVLIASIYPLVVDVSIGPDDDPWMFHLGGLLGKVVLTALYVGLVHPELRQRRVATLVLRRAFGWFAWWRLAGDPAETKKQRRSALLILAATYSHVSMVFFLWSTRFVDTVVSAIIVGAFPPLFVLVMGRQDRATGSRGRYRTPTMGDVAALTLAFAGMGAVTWGGATEVNLQGSFSRTLVGVGLAALATTGGVLTAKSFRWGSDLAEEAGTSGARSESALVLIAYGVGNLLSLPLVAGIAATGGWRMSATGFQAAVLCGLLVMFPSNILFIKANLLTQHLSVNNLVYVQTVFSLSWLWLFTTIEVGKPILVLAGAMTVVVANVLSGGVGDWIVDRANHHRRGGRTDPRNGG